MLDTRATFVERFGEAQADAVVAAAEMHENGVHDKRGSDPFRWAVVIAIGYECVSKYADAHGITVAPSEFRDWVRECGDLGNHDGDVDYLALMAGAYQDFIPAYDEVS